MPLPPLSHQLSTFEQIEILRNEIEQFEEEFKKTESRIRDVLYQVEKQRFLTTVHHIFQHGQTLPEAQALPELNSTRETLASALEAMKQALSSLESASGGAPIRVPQARPAQMPTRSAAVAPTYQPLAQPPFQSGGQSGGQPGAAPVRKNRFDAF
ncbi:MAG: hypothetical protein WCT04_00845 [Planctomycetota bacterium]